MLSCRISLTALPAAQHSTKRWPHWW